MAGRLYRMAKVVSANPASWGIVDANQISGFRTVATQADLYSIAACILSSAYGDGTTTGADAVGQIWHVQDTNKDFRLTSWANRGKAAGWTEELTSESLVGKINAAENKADSAINKANTNTAAINDVKSTANNNALKIKANADSISELKTAVGKKADSSRVDIIAGSVSSNAGDIIDIKNKLTKKADLVNGKLNPEQLPDIDTTLYELAPNNTLPSTLADINKNHIYLVKADTAGTNNVYAEYIYTGTSSTYDDTKWEKLGEVSAKVDLSEYYTKSEIDKKVTAINKNSISSLLIDKQDSTDAVFVVLKRAGGENTLSTPIPVVNNASDNHHNGLMSPAMLTKLNSLTNYAHPTHTAKTSGLYKITVDGLGHVSVATPVKTTDLADLGALTSAPTFMLSQSGGDDYINIDAIYNEIPYSISLGTAGADHPGLMSAAAYTKLDGIKSFSVNDVVAGRQYSLMATDGTDAFNVGNIFIRTAGNGNTEIEAGGKKTDINAIAAYARYDINGNHIDATYWKKADLVAISNDELTSILV